MPATPAFPLDLQRTGYSYVERHNTKLVELLERHVLRDCPTARILDIGCGAGANARALRKLYPQAYIEGIEPNASAAAQAREVMNEVCHGTTTDWLKRVGSAPVPTPFDAIVLSDVIEHIADPVTFLEALAAAPALSGATWVISVPNYGVWYNRVNTLLGRFNYGWSGLYDRTHLRFFTRRSLKALLDYVGLETVGESATPSLVQSMAPLLRKMFDSDVARGENLSLTRSPAYSVYEGWVEPVESLVCGAWPSLLGFQIVVAARLRGAHARSPISRGHDASE